jgi:hypothetical protein
MKILLYLLLGTSVLFGQFEYGEVLGTVRDASLGVVTRAKITLRNLDTNVSNDFSKLIPASAVRWCRAIRCVNCR